jgi:cytochrome c oxidase subunit 4
MSTETAELPDIDSALREGQHAPKDKYFVQVALWLAALTALEVIWSYLPWDDWGNTTPWAMFEIGMLLAMMALKFYMVAAVFMHLKFDKKLLTGVFYAGLFLAVGVYIVVLVTMEVFANGSPGFAP